MLFYKARKFIEDIKLFIITDTHNTLSGNDDFYSLIKEDYDVCLLLGDISFDDLMLIKNMVIDKPIYAVPGNHDSWDQYQKNGIENIHLKQIIINGITITGFGGSLRYKPGDYPCFTDKESVMIIKETKKSDILISHDSSKRKYERKGMKSGLTGISYYLKKNKVPLHIHGHHHYNDIKKLRNGTISVGCYGCRIVDTSDLIK